MAAPDGNEASDGEQAAHYSQTNARRTESSGGDAFVLATVILANSLFFGGIKQIPYNPGTPTILPGVAITFLVLGVRDDLAARAVIGFGRMAN